jgi:hypothetical protein
MRTIRIALAVVGLCAIGYAVAGAVRAPAIVPGRHIVFLLAVLALHDAVWMPLILLVGVLVRAIVPGRARAYVQGALIISASVAVVAWPLVLGRGRIADNPSALPRDYPAGLAITIAATWVGAAILAGVRRSRARRGPGLSSPTPLPQPVVQRSRGEVGAEHLECGGTGSGEGEPGIVDGDALPKKE